LNTDALQGPGGDGDEVRSYPGTVRVEYNENVWRRINIHIATKYSLFKSLVPSTYLSGCETWSVLVGAGNKFKTLWRPGAPGSCSTSPTWSIRPTS